jgi:hypothetical protein
MGMDAITHVPYLAVVGSDKVVRVVNYVTR